MEAEYTFDNNKLLFYFTADGRIDFRELVKDLAAVFRTRIDPVDIVLFFVSYHLQRRWVFQKKPAKAG